LTPSIRSALLHGTPLDFGDKAWSERTFWIDRGTCHAIQGKCRCRHRMPKKKREVTNWAAYDAACAGARA
jgi:hypothetical protein